MTLTDLTLEALAYIQPSNAGNNQATIALASAPQLRRIATDLTATLRDICAVAPSFFRKTVGIDLAAPVVISVGVTEGSQVVTTASSFVSGSTIVIDGEPRTFNQILQENGVKRLLYPYRGATSTQSATLYGDVVLLGADVSNVIGNAKLSGGQEVTKAINITSLYKFSTNRGETDYGRNRTCVSTTPLVGIPAKYYVESVITAETGGRRYEMRLRVNPLPRVAHGMSFTVQVKGEEIAVADLGADGSPSDYELILPDDAVENLFRPLFLLKWSGCPWYRDADGRKAIERDAKPAMAQMADYRALLPGPRSSTPP